MHQKTSPTPVLLMRPFLVRLLSNSLDKWTTGSARHALCLTYRLTLRSQRALRVQSHLQLADCILSEPRGLGISLKNLLGVTVIFFGFLRFPGPRGAKRAPGGLNHLSYINLNPELRFQWCTYFSVAKTGTLAAEVLQKTKKLLPRWVRAAKKYTPRPAWECDFHFLQHL